MLTVTLTVQSDNGELTDVGAAMYAVVDRRRRYGETLSPRDLRQLRDAEIVFVSDVMVRTPAVEAWMYAILTQPNPPELART